jgi:predicted Zn-dependent protease
MNKIILLFLFSLFLNSCLSNSTKSGSIGVDRGQLLLIPSSEIRESAKIAYTDVIKKAQKDKTLNTDKKLLNRLREISKKLVQQVATFRADATNWKWETNLIDSKEVNAWCMPGGKIVFYTGIIEKLNLNDDEIAAIMGHEISHALREHGREQASREFAGQVGLNLLTNLLGLNKKNSSLGNMALKTTFLLPNSRTQEQEADRMGVELAAKAGYNPYSAVKVWQKMSDLDKSSKPEILSTHPSHATRIADLQSYAKKLYPLYQKSKSKK